MRRLKTRGLIPLLAVGAIATIAAAAKWTWPPLPEPLAEATSFLSPGPWVGESQYFQLVPSSIYDGDTLRVTDGSKEIKIRLCGIDAPEKEQPMGIEARDHLRSLIAQGDGSLIVVPVKRDRYKRTVADVYVPLAGTEEEIYLNGQMILDGMAYHYEQYSSDCPDDYLLVRVEERAKAAGKGVWMNPDAERPWEYRRRMRQGSG